MLMATSRDVAALTPARDGEGFIGTEPLPSLEGGGDMDIAYMITPQGIRGSRRWNGLPGVSLWDRDGVGLTWRILGVGFVQTPFSFGFVEPKSGQKHFRSILEEQSHLFWIVVMAPAGNINEG